MTKRAPKDFESHGMYLHPAYRSWVGAKDRCQTMTPKVYPHYRAKGITVCTEWSESFIVFWKAMGPTWFKGATLDRIDNDKGYGPGNCRWVPKSEQPKNRGMCHKIESPWGIVTGSEAARRLGMSPCAFRVRYRAGLRGDELFAPPVFKGARAVAFYKREAEG